MCDLVLSLELKIHFINGSEMMCSSCNDRGTRENPRILQYFLFNCLRKITKSREVVLPEIIFENSSISVVLKFIL